MKLLFRAVALGLLCSGIAAAQPPPVIRLWNGHDVTGWVSYFKPGAVTPSHFWSASDGVLHLDKTPPGYLRTQQSFSNYRLHVEWRWAGSVTAGIHNSGIFVLQRPPDAIWPYSVQVQVKTGLCGDLIAQGGLVFTPGNPNLTMKKLAPPREQPPGEWNTTDITCRGASIEVLVNGLRQNFVDNLPATSGQIALQMEGHPIDFRNIWLEPL